jgi:short chain dehydrogenase
MVQPAAGSPGHKSPRACLLMCLVTITSHSRLLTCVWVQMGCSYSTRQVESQHFVTWCDNLPSMEEKVVVITGTTSGTGLVAAKTLAATGAQVVMLNRASERADAALAAVKEAARKPAAPDAVHQFECDLQDFSSVRAAAARVLNLDVVASAGIDVLANNAGAHGKPASAIATLCHICMDDLMGCSES